MSTAALRSSADVARRSRHAPWPTATAAPAHAGGTAARGADDRIEPRRLIAFLAMVFGMFMAILDIQIVSASLTEIQAGLARQRRRDLLGADRLSDRRGGHDPAVGLPVARAVDALLFAISAGGFTAASLLCAISTTIDQMIVWRAMQGFIGGGMIPTVFAAAFTIFPRSQHGPWSRR